MWNPVTEQKLCSRGPQKGDVSLFGAFSVDSEIQFTLTVPSPENEMDGAAQVAMVIHADGWGQSETHYRELPLEERASSPTQTTFAITLTMDSLCDWAGLSDNGLFYYHYRVTRGEETRCFGGESPTNLSEINGYDNERQLLVFAREYKTSRHIRSGVIYHIFVDRFRRSGRCEKKCDAVLDPDWDHGIPQFAEHPGEDLTNNVFFGGDLYGVVEKLPYIQSLGVSTIYLSPVFDAASNHKYDTGDYLTVDKMFGGDDALRVLCAEAKNYGIDIILDGVFNHTGSDSVYFNKEDRYYSVGAYQSQESPYYPWYTFRHYPDDYECWWGVKILPKVNTKEASYRSFIYDQVIDKWMSAGVSGWRIDVADELDNGFLDGLRNAVRAHNPDAPIIGEVWEDASDKVSYGNRRAYLRGHQLDSVMNYPLREAILGYILHGDCALFRKNTEELYRRYPKQSSDTQMNFLGTHDTARILSILGDSDWENLPNAKLAHRRMSKLARANAVNLLKVAYALIVACPGVPCIFYGDEVGMEGYHDPFCRKPFPWNNMEEGILYFYRRLGEIRKSEPVLADGLFRILELSEEYLVLERFNETESIRVVVNRSLRDFSYPVSFPSIELIYGRIVSKTYLVRRHSVAFFKEIRKHENP